MDKEIQHDTRSGHYLLLRSSSLNLCEEFSFYIQAGTQFFLSFFVQNLGNDAILAVILFLET